jgi:radical SAM protein with 4Fe4S-binding SPASM domain
MPIPAGNLLQQDLTDLYCNSLLFKQLRAEIIPDGCESCFYGKECNGGLRCLSHAVTGTFDASDPGCSMAGMKKGRVETLPSGGK